MTYHSNALGDATGTYVNHGRGVADFRVSGLNGTPTDSEKARTKILAMVKAIPGIEGADAAWGAGGIITVNFRAVAGTPVSDTASAIKRNAAGVGAQIHAGVTVTAPSVRHTSSDIVRTAAAPAEPAATPDLPAVTDAPPAGPAPIAETSSMPIWPFALGGGALVLGVAAYFLLRKKKSAQLTVRAA